MTGTPDAVSARGVRVALLATRFPEPSQTFVFDQIDGLIDHGHSVQIYANLRTPDGLAHENGQRFLPLTRFSGGKLVENLLTSSGRTGKLARRWHARAVERQCRAALRNSDLVLCNFGPVGLQVARAARALEGRHAPIWTIFHGYDMSSYLLKHGERVYDELFVRGDRFLAISDHWAERLTQLGCPPERIRVLHMGVDCDAIPFVSPRHPGRVELRILFVGRLVEKKGAEFVIRALAWLKQSHPRLEWSLTIAGDGPLSAELEALAQNLGLNDRVNFLGLVSSGQVRGELSQADVFLLPSVVSADGDKEGIPVSLMEAMAAGVPVVSTVHSGIPELIEHNVSGLLAPERDPVELGEHIATLLVDDARRAQLAGEARKVVEQRFNQAKLKVELATMIDDRVALGR
jgi:colanic acid/amylovoran biosynthesis glycosyltransferase